MIYNQDIIKLYFKIKKNIKNKLMRKLNYFNMYHI